ncbi:thiamine pyrophosphate carrier protein 1 [Tachypleus tridentatus]|uniref:thiamine pyrophosphate carrier protein 1 n=1 Tax=Tachypleus tridentatus TaxID=6853 RepID=UPI003FD4CCEA
MVGFEPQTNQLSRWDYSAAGAVSGITTRFLCQPLDVLKIRFQLQVEPIRRTSVTSKYRGLTHATRCIIKEEKVVALWKGHVPAQFLSVVYGAVQFLSFEVLTECVWKLLSPTLTNNWRPIVHFTCGGISGCVATIAAQPFDVIRTRLVGQGEPKLYKGTIHAVQSILKEEGFFKLYRGLSPTLLQVGPYVGAQFGFYRLFQEIWNAALKITDTKIGITESLVCGSCAGMSAKAVVYPLDLIKKRLQVQGFEKARKPFGSSRLYTGIIHCFVTVLKEEGFRGLYKGFSPSLLKSALSTGLSFAVYEKMCQILLLKYKL